MDFQILEAEVRDAVRAVGCRIVLEDDAVVGGFARGGGESEGGQGEGCEEDSELHCWK